MLSDRFSSRASVPIIIVPFCVLLACASGPPKDTSLAPPPSDSSNLDPQDARTIESLFAGRFPGVIVSARDGGGIQIRIRGGSNTFRGNDEPLYIVDNTPIRAGPEGALFINPYDIERIEVLKNPEDISVYGSQGSNGVIKITTKRPGKR